MKTWIVLFRGINVGGKNIVKMAELKSELTTAGFENVRTYIQSGNVVLQSNLRSAKSVSEKIETCVHQRFKITPAVYVIDEKAFRSVVASNPYPQAAAEPKSLHVCFLNAKPRKPNWKRIGELQSDTEEVKIVDKALFAYAPDGVRHSKLFSAIEGCLGVGMTARNWRTVSKLLEMIESSR